jgi:hypothetical protein
LEFILDKRDVTAQKVESRQTCMAKNCAILLGLISIASALIQGNRSQVQGSTFKVKNKEGFKDPKSLLKMLIFPNNCQFGSKFWIRPDEADAFLVNTRPNAAQGRECNPWPRPGMSRCGDGQPSP